MIYNNNEVEKIDLEINQGDDHQITFNLTDDNGSLIDTSIVSLFLEHLIATVIH